MLDSANMVADVIRSFRDVPETSDLNLLPKLLPLVGQEPVIPMSAITALPKESLLDVLEKRRSTRFFSDREIATQDLAEVISIALKQDTEVWSDIEQDMPLEVFAMCLRVSGIEPGTYRVDPSATELTLVADSKSMGNFADLTIQSEFGGAAVILSIAGNIELATKKFGGHGYRLLMTRVSSILYGIWLNALAEGMVGTVFAGFIPASVRRSLSNDVSSRQQIFSLALGHGLPAAISESKQTSSPHEQRKEEKD